MPAAASSTSCGLATPSPSASTPNVLPGAGDELHRTDGAVPRRVAVPVPAVGVRDRGVAVAVEDRTQHRGAVRAVDRAADEGARLDLADRRQQAHRQVAAGRGAGDRGAVGLEEDVGDVGLHGRACGRAGRGDADGGWRGLALRRLHDGDRRIRLGGFRPEGRVGEGSGRGRPRPARMRDRGRGTRQRQDQSQGGGCAESTGTSGYPHATTQHRDGSNHQTDADQLRVNTMAWQPVRSGRFVAVPAPCNLRRQTRQT